MRYMIKTEHFVARLATHDELVGLVRAATMTPRDLVRELPDGDWRRAGEHPALRGCWPRDDRDGGRDEDGDATASDGPTRVDRPRPALEPEALPRFPAPAPASARRQAVAVGVAAAACLVAGLVLVALALGGGGCDASAVPPRVEEVGVDAASPELAALAEAIYEAERVLVAARRDVTCLASREAERRFEAGRPYVVQRRAGGSCRIAAQGRSGEVPAELLERAGGGGGGDCEALARELEGHFVAHAAALAERVATQCDEAPHVLELAAREAALARLPAVTHAVRRGELEAEVGVCFERALGEATRLHGALGALRCPGGGCGEQGASAQAALRAAAGATAAALCLGAP